MLEIIGFVLLLVISVVLLAAGGVMMLASVTFSYNRGDYFAALVILLAGTALSCYTYSVCPFFVGMR